MLTILALYMEWKENETIIIKKQIYLIYYKAVYITLHFENDFFFFLSGTSGRFWSTLEQIIIEIVEFYQTGIFELVIFI